MPAAQSGSAPEATDAADALLDRNRADVVLVIPTGFADELLKGRRVTVQALVNGENSNLASAAVSYLDLFTRDYSEKIATQAMLRMGAQQWVPIDYRPRIWFNPELKSARFLVPGLMGYVLIISTVISTALSVVREKERGTMEQIIVSPVRGREFMIGKIIPYFVIAAILAVGIILAGRYLFDVPIRGSITLLSGALFFFIIGGLGMGLAISTIASTQESAFFIAIFTTVLPTQILSGFIFPIENMPSILQWVAHVVPATYLLQVLRAILLKGAPFDAFWPSFLALVIFAVTTMNLATLRMQRAGHGTGN